MVFDARDMVERDFPDKLGVITYVSQLYEYFKNKIPGIFNFDTIVICAVMYISENINYYYYCTQTVVDKQRLE